MHKLSLSSLKKYIIQWKHGKYSKASILESLVRKRYIKVLQKLLTPKGFAFSKSMDRTQMQFGETFSIFAKNNQRLKRQMQKI